MSGSEVARIRQQIHDEYIAAQRGLHGIAITASHEFITQRMENVGKLHDQLITMVGQDEATKIVCETAFKTIEHDPAVIEIIIQDVATNQKMEISNVNQ